MERIASKESCRSGLSERLTSIKWRGTRRIEAIESKPHWLRSNEALAVRCPGAENMDDMVERSVAVVAVAAADDMPGFTVRCDETALPIVEWSIDIAAAPVIDTLGSFDEGLVPVSERLYR